MATTKGRIYLGSICVFGCEPSNDIGVAGQADFGVGVYPGDPSALGLSPMTGHDQPGHDNYGNYVHANGSVVCWVPAFWLRIGSASSPRYATYGANAHDCLPESAFADEAAANAAGYMLHRAFTDGGQLKRGFFVDKYLASPDVTGQLAVSVKDGVPISLTTSSTYTRSQTMPGCVGQLHDAVTLSRARGAGGWNATSIFIYDALARLSLCHAQAAASATHCAWYDATGTTSFPKGCNNNALRDANDADVLYVTAGDAGAAAKGRTGSAAPFAKTAHNGQPCGIADLNGLMWEVALGLTAPGSSATDSTQRADGHAWVLKDSVALASLTAGWNGATDACQSAATIETLYDYYADFLPWGASTATMRFGNGSEPVFSGALSGSEYLRTCCGVPAATGESTNGTNLFGQDGNYRYNRANLFPLVGAHWSNGSGAGVFARHWLNHRTNANAGVGFRASAYGL
jgi:hypothetical protein